MSRARLVLTCAVSLFLLLVVPVSAAGMWVSPSGGDYDTTYTVHASGFVPGERVDTWVNKPYQWRVGQGEYTADGGGPSSLNFAPT